MGTVLIPFKKMETEEDFESFEELCGDIIDFFARTPWSTSAPAR
jgi:sulfite reductase alpha subunit